MTCFLVCPNCNKGQLQENHNLVQMNVFSCSVLEIECDSCGKDFDVHINIYEEKTSE